MKYRMSVLGWACAILGLLVGCGTRDRQTGETTTVELPGGATMEMVWMGSGSFTMGSPEDEPGRYTWESPQHEVLITRGFWMGKYEITQKQWESVMGDRPWTEGQYVQENPDHPAVRITCEDIDAFLGKLNEAAGDSVYRLPTEAEWEYACRAGTMTRWCFGNEESLLGDYAWYVVNAWHEGERYAHAVGTKLPNLWGIHDMHGNVSEWCQDRYTSTYYDMSPDADPPGPASGTYRVLRGGNFREQARGVRSATRYGFSPTDRRDYIGTRLVRMDE